MHLATLITKVSPQVVNIFSQFKENTYSAEVVVFIHTHPRFTAKEIAKKLKYDVPFVRGVISRLKRLNIIEPYSKCGREYCYVINKISYDQIRTVATVFQKTITKN
jgi:predicted transcriptional regulator